MTNLLLKDEFIIRPEGFILDTAKLFVLLNIVIAPLFEARNERTNI